VVSKEFLDKAREELLDRREALEAMRRQIDESSASLSDPQVEFEERAQQEKMQQELDEQDRLNRNELYAVNMALQRIETGTYGLCQECGEEISQARLEAIPWADLCIDCADEQEEPEPYEPFESRDEGPPMTQGYEELSGGELCSAIYEYLRYHKLVDLDELQVQSRGRRVTLSGALPSTKQIEILYEVIEDTFGVHDIVNNVNIDPEAWERKDRTSERIIPEQDEGQEFLEGEAEETDIFTAIKEGEPMDPENRLEYEKTERAGEKPIKR